MALARACKTFSDSIGSMRLYTKAPLYPCLKASFGSGTQRVQAASNEDNQAQPKVVNNSSITSFSDPLYDYVSQEYPRTSLKTHREEDAAANVLHVQNGGQTMASIFVDKHPQNSIMDPCFDYLSQHYTRIKVAPDGKAKR